MGGGWVREGGGKKSGGVGGPDGVSRLHPAVAGGARRVAGSKKFAMRTLRTCRFSDLCRSLWPRKWEAVPVVNDSAVAG
jgi:hypothetical protein